MKSREKHELEEVKNAVMSVDGIKNCIVNEEVFLAEITVCTSKDVENKVKAKVFHAIAKGMFEL